ncbi:hypothetical protein HRUBRA_00783 [Pseudohaliea rubra DSM 19751]|uniref:Uncharacterized protein n=1 Tax=Pseudohaliea rubra DSM 19751 TaxID=1265313 RepID=A0A095X193_9GAMM|nr:hypothetical protein HRUBRA_00783 [Pseudohaliea rubra DSM 19751]
MMKAANRQSVDSERRCFCFFTVNTGNTACLGTTVTPVAKLSRS